MKVLVTGAGALLGQGIIRSLQMSHLDYEVVAADPSPMAAGLYWTPHRYLVPMADDARFIEVIEAVIEVERPDVLLVGTDVELPVFAEHRDHFLGKYGIHVLVSDSRTIAIANDKLLTHDFLVESGLNPPRSSAPSAADALIDEVGFPLIVKPRFGARSVGVTPVHSSQELEVALTKVNDPIVQELLDPEHGEFTAGTLYFDESCVAAIVMRRELRDGNTYRAFVEQDDEILKQVVEHAEKLKAFGPANFQFRVTDGQVRVFEINCRFSGTTPLRALAGFNEVVLSLERLLKGIPVMQPDVQPITIVRHWSETILPSDWSELSGSD